MGSGDSERYQVINVCVPASSSKTNPSRKRYQQFPTRTPKIFVTYLLYMAIPWDDRRGLSPWQLNRSGPASDDQLRPTMEVDSALVIMNDTLGDYDISPLNQQYNIQVSLVSYSFFTNPANQTGL